MWSTSKDLKKGYVINAGPFENFLYNKRSTRISDPQLKIKNQIMGYHWTFEKDPQELEKVL